MSDSISVPIERLSAEQASQEALRAVQALADAVAQNHADTIERLTSMSDVFDQLSTEVQKTLGDEKTRDQRISDLATSLDDSHKVAQDAIDRANLDDAQKADLQAQLDAAKAKAAAAVQQLQSGELPPAPAPATATTPAPVDPTAPLPTPTADTPAPSAQPTPVDPGPAPVNPTTPADAPIVEPVPSGTTVTDTTSTAPATQPVVDPQVPTVAQDAPPSLPPAPGQ